MSQKPRPALLPPDLNPTQPLPPTSRAGVDDARFRVAEALERPEAVREGLTSGRVRALNSETAAALFGSSSAPMQQDAEGPKPIPSPPPTTTATLPVEATPLEPVTGRTDEEVALSTKVPLYVLKQLRRRYAENGVTIRNQILLALRAVGLEIDDRDITDERKRARR